ncbi:MAG: VWA domain-containing protein [Sedimentisphaerales bacterium]
MNQGMVKKHRRIKLYALGVSVFAHIVGLSVFAAVKISQSSPVRLQTTTVVSISQAAKLADRQAVTPKPKVSPVDSKPFDSSGALKAGIIKGRPIVKADGKGTQANARLVFDAPKEDYQRQAEEVKQPIESQAFAATSGRESAGNIEFFDSPAQGRRICYVVDCSGSMRGLWKRVQEELIDSIGKLQQDYYFCVIVFGGGSILESGGGKMVRATERAKKEAYSFISSIQPRGMTNATDALERAIMIRDRAGVGASVIYFLTDGFELSEQDGSRFAHKVATMHRSFAPKTQINTIGFWCTEEDGKVLETIAKESGGQFTFITGGREQKKTDN